MSVRIDHADGSNANLLIDPLSWLTAFDCYRPFRLNFGIPGGPNSYLRDHQVAQTARVGSFPFQILASSGGKVNVTLGTPLTDDHGRTHKAGVRR
jgi:hypothetical protein